MSKSTKHILFLSSWYPSAEHPTLGNFVQRHAESVALLNEVTTLYVSKRKEQDGPIEIKEEMIRGVRTITVYFSCENRNMWKKRKAFKRGVAYIFEHLKLSFDLVHMNVIFNSGWQALYLKKHYQLNYIITDHWTGYHDSTERKIPAWKRMMAYRVAKESIQICPVSENLAEAMKSFGLKGNYKVVYNVVDTELFNPKPTNHSVFRWIHVSHLGDDHKNVSGLIRAFYQAQLENDKMELHIFGDGATESYSKLANDLGLVDKNFKIAGEQPLVAIAKAMSEADALVLFSNYENLPCVIVEALSCGIPVVSTRVGGIAEIINPSNGYLIEKGNEQELTEALLKMSKDYSTFDSKIIRKYALEKFSTKSISEQYDNVYEEALRPT